MNKINLNGFKNLLVKLTSKWFVVIPAVLLVWALGVYLVMFALVPAWQEWSSGKFIRSNKLVFSESIDSAAFVKNTPRLQRRLASATTGGAYMVINTTSNRFWLYKNNEVITEGQVSTGSYIQLVVDENRNWIFKTPKGIHTIKGKITDPVWRRPDWAFIEEGLPVPHSTHPSRYEYGVLGDYALSLGDGYLIHGTLYQRLLGMPVTHGCIRMNDQDLEAVFKTLQVGSKVVIY